MTLTADEFLEKKLKEFEVTKHTTIEGCAIDVVMVEFAKLHVEAALKQASEEVYVSDHTHCEIDRDSIINCYPLELIK